MRKLYYLLFLATCASRFLSAESVANLEIGPWFTGPLLTPSAIIVPAGDVNFEPYLFVNRVLGSYDGDWHSHSQNKSTSVTIQLPTQIGLTSFMDVQISPLAVYVNKHGQTAIRFGDFPIQLDFQLLREAPGIPNIKFNIGEEFPTGHYQNLNPAKLGADASGGGSFVTYAGLTFGKLFKFADTQFVRMRVNLSYAVPSAVDVEGFNTYGGGFGAHGKVYPGNELSFLVGFEYTFALHWAFAIDMLALQVNKTRFSGFAGTTVEVDPNEQIPPFAISSVGNKSSEQFSLAPAIEYNLNERYGFIGGMWFSVAGRNSSRFLNTTIAFNMYF